MKKMSFSNVSFIFLCLCCNLAASQKAIQFFRDDYIYAEQTKTFYKEHLTPAAWYDAVAICISEGASLAVPSSKAEMEVIHGLQSADTKNQYVWIGLNDFYSKGVYLTLSGKTPTYTDWVPNEPNNHRGKEDCVAMINGGNYNDDDCWHRFTFFCSAPDSHVEDSMRNTLCDTDDIGYIYSLYTRHCYKLHLSPRTWFEAFTTCVLEKAELAIINDDKEANLLADEMANHPAAEIKGNCDKDQAFIGMSDMISHGIFMNIDGTSLSEAGYEVWEDERNKAKSEAHCGSILRTGKLAKKRCYDRLMFFCEKVPNIPNDFDTRSDLAK